MPAARHGERVDLLLHRTLLHYQLEPFLEQRLQHFRHLLGIDANKEVMTQLQRPMKLVDNGSMVQELIG